MIRTKQNILAVILILMAASFTCPAQQTEGKKQMKSPFNLVKSVESIGSDILSLFGASDDDQNAQSKNRGGNPRNKARVAVVVSNGKAVLNGDAKTCESGNGICQFKIYLQEQAPKEGSIVSAQAILRPKMKRLIVEFDQPLNSTYQNEQGKVVLNVHRRTSDPADEDGVIIVNNTRLAIQNGDYEVVGNRVVFNLQ